MIDWQTGEPPKMERLLVQTLGQPDTTRAEQARNKMRGTSNAILFGRMTTQGWIDDNSLPILNVVAWSDLQ